MAQVKFRLGKEPYTHHFTAVRIGQDGLDTDLEIALEELGALNWYLAQISTGLEVIGVENEKIKEWLEDADYQIRDTRKTLDSLVNKLLRSPEIARIPIDSKKFNAYYAEATEEMTNEHLREWREKYKDA